MARMGDASMTTDRVFEDLWQGYLSFGVPDSPVNRTALHTAYVMTGMYNACDPPHLMGFRALFSHRRKEWSLYVGVIVADVFVPVMAVIRDDIIGPTQDDLRCTPTHRPRVRRCCQDDGHGRNRQGVGHARRRGKFGVRSHQRIRAP